jgi:hypothetical protein
MHFGSQCRVTMLPWNTHPVSPDPIVGFVPSMDQRKCSKINKTGFYPPAHNDLVAGPSPAGPTNKINRLSGLLSPPC